MPGSQYGKNAVAAWPKLLGTPFITVSPVGTAAGYPVNNNADFGPDTLNTTTSGIQEALNFSAANAEGPILIYLLSGTFSCSGTIVVAEAGQIICGSGFDVTSIQYTGSGGSSTNFISMSVAPNHFEMSDLKLDANSKTLNSVLALNTASGFTEDSYPFLLHAVVAANVSSVTTVAILDGCEDGIVDHCRFDTGTVSWQVPEGSSLVIGTILPMFVWAGNCVVIGGSIYTSVKYTNTTVTGNFTSYGLYWNGGGPAVVQNTGAAASFYNIHGGMMIIGNSAKSFIEGTDAVGVLAKLYGVILSIGSLSAPIPFGLSGVQMRTYFDHCIIDGETVAQLLSSGLHSTGSIAEGSDVTHQYTAGQSFQLSSPAVPSTGGTYQNTYGAPVRIFVLTAGSASYTITDNFGNVSSSIPIAAGSMIVLQPEETITVTYSTLTWEFAWG